MKYFYDEITPVSEMDYEDNQKLVIFDDYVCDKNQRESFKDDIKIVRWCISVSRLTKLQKISD